MEYAILFHGKIGTLTSSSTSLFTPKPYESGILIKQSFNSLQKHVLQPNNNAFDIFLHSWNPQNRKMLDKLYKPVKSRHDPPNITLPSQSQMRSLRFVLEMKKGYEIETQKTYKLVFMFRYDLTFSRDLIIHELPQSSLIFPQHCCRTPTPVKVEKPHAWIADYCHVSHYLGTRERPSFVEYNMYFMDWFVIASSHIADTFSQIDTHFQVYKKKLAALEIQTLWTHFLWSYHTHFVLNATNMVRFHLLGGFDYALTRHPYPSLKMLNNKVNISTPKSTLFESAHRMCPHIGKIVQHQRHKVERSSTLYVKYPKHLKFM